MDFVASIRFFQAFSLVGAIMIIVVSLMYWARRPGVRLLLVPVLSWAILAAIYYAAVMADVLPPGDLARFFSSVLRSVEVTLILGGLLILVGRVGAHE